MPLAFEAAAPALGVIFRSRGETIFLWADGVLVLAVCVLVEVLVVDELLSERITALMFVEGALLLAAEVCWLDEVDEEDLPAREDSRAPESSVP